MVLLQEITFFGNMSSIKDFLNLVIIADSMEECVRRLLTWREGMGRKGLRVNAGKTKIMICGTGLDPLQSSGEFQCAACCTEVGSNSMQWLQSLGSQEKQRAQLPEREPPTTGALDV